MLGIDPGLVATGYGVLEGAPGSSAVLAAGVIATTTDLSFETRLRLIYDGVHDVLVKHTPDVVVLEDLYAEYKFPRTALLMAHARGVVCLAAGQCGVPVMALAPAEVKRTVAFNGAASKQQVQHAIGRLLNLAEPPHPSHVADALALAWTGLSRAKAVIGAGGPSSAASHGAGEPSSAARNAARGPSSAARDAADGPSSAARDAAGGPSSAARDAADGPSSAARGAADGPSSAARHGAGGRSPGARDSK